MSQTRKGPSTFKANSQGRDQSTHESNSQERNPRTFKAKNHGRDPSTHESNKKGNVPKYS